LRFKLETGANVSKTFGKKIQKHKKLRKRAAKKGDIMNAIELLKADHDTVDRLFQKVKADTEGSTHKQLFEQIKAELEVHTHIEETIFYPRLKQEPELEDIVLEGIEEHHQAKMFLRELANLKEDSEKFEPKLKVLMEDITHHVQEEEGDMFIDVQKVIDAGELERLGAEMEKEKQNFKKSQSAGSGK
jgi:hemerythrin superfamily protein